VLTTDQVVALGHQSGIRADDLAGCGIDEFAGAGH
jgi:hypothetical protein